MRSICLAAVLCASVAMPAAAQDFQPLFEARLGANVTGVELWTGFRPYPDWVQFERLDTVQVELLFNPPEIADVLSYLGSPRIAFGGHLSTAGRASMVYSGLNWQWAITGPVFVEATVGGALTNSTLENATPPDRNVGCPALLYFSAGVGAEIAEGWNVIAQVYHASHAALCGLDAPNRGLNGYGVKIGHSF
jgi:hypothetical protein